MLDQVRYVFALLWLLAFPILLFWALTALTYAASLAVEAHARKHLGMATLVGVPELQGQGAHDALLTQGIYGRVRHPRYLGAALGYAPSAAPAPSAPGRNLPRSRGRGSPTP